MKIKNLIIIPFLSTIATKAQLTFSVNAGANMGNIVTKIDGKKDSEIKPSTGYIISGDVNIPAGKNLLFQTGLQFESVHNKVNTNSTQTFSPPWVFPITLNLRQLSLSERPRLVS